MRVFTIYEAWLDSCIFHEPVITEHSLREFRKQVDKYAQGYWRFQDRLRLRKIQTAKLPCGWELTRCVGMGEVILEPSEP